MLTSLWNLETDYVKTDKLEYLFTFCWGLWLVFLFLLAAISLHLPRETVFEKKKLKEIRTHNFLDMCPISLYHDTFHVLDVVHHKHV